MGDAALTFAPAQRSCATKPRGSRLGAPSPAEQAGRAWGRRARGRHGPGLAGLRPNLIPPPPRLPAISRPPSGLRGEIDVSGRTQCWAPRARRPGPSCAARTPAQEAEATGSHAPALRPRVPSAALRRRGGPGGGRAGAGGHPSARARARGGGSGAGRGRWAGARAAGRMLTRARDVRAGTGLPEAGPRRRRAETGSRAEQGRAAERRGGAEQQSSGGSAGRRAPEPAAPPPGPRHAGSGRRAATPEPAAAGRAGHER